MPMKLTGNTVLITGGASGIGFGLAEALLARKNKVIICGRRIDRLREAQAKLPGLHTRVCDVTDGDARRELAVWATDSFPDLNVLINNAGIQRNIDLKAGSDEISDGESEIAVNLEAPIMLTALLVPHLLRRKEAAIINVSSGLIYQPAAGLPIYCATKAALHVYTHLLRRQLANTGIRVYEAVPPMVDTELNKAGRDKQGKAYRGIKTEDYIPTFIAGLAGDEYEIRYQQGQ